MTPDKLPPHALFVEWGRFRAGAVGLPAIITLAVIAVVAVLKLTGWF
jgi:hypothetical protein